VREGLGFAIEEIAEIYERAMTLVTGIFGMNVAGLPGLQGPASFWWVMILIIASGGATLAVLFWRRLL
jgi:zinc transporter